jgi:hypothetical protein
MNWKFSVVQAPAPPGRRCSSEDTEALAATEASKMLAPLLPDWKPLGRRLWCKLKPTERSVKLRLVSDCELGSSCECRVPPEVRVDWMAFLQSSVVHPGGLLYESENWGSGTAVYVSCGPGLGGRLARRRSTTGFHSGVIGFFSTSTTPSSLVASSTDAFSGPAIAIINRSGFASWSL